MKLARSLIADGQAAVIVNADASQVYRDIPILSAQPTPQEQALAPHRLYGEWDGACACDAAQWADAARSAIRDGHAASALPILVGGSGLYIRTLLDGIAPVPPIDALVRERVRAMDVGEAHSALMAADPAAASRLNPADTTRIRRALEVVQSTGRTLADWQREKAGGIGNAIRLTPLILLPPRDWLRARCDARFSAMIDDGAIDEVRMLIDRELAPSLPVMRAIGVPEIAAFLAGGMSLADATEQASAATRQYAKRQYTWFRHQPPTAWPRSTSELNDIEIDDLVIKLRQSLLTS